MKVHSVVELQAGLPEGYDGVNFYDCGCDLRMKPVDKELTRLRARTCVVGDLNGTDLEVFLDAEHRLVAIVKFHKFVSKDWLAAFDRRFGQQLLKEAQQRLVVQRAERKVLEDEWAKKKLELT